VLVRVFRSGSLSISRVNSRLTIIKPRFNDMKSSYRLMTLLAIRGCLLLLGKSAH